MSDLGKRYEVLVPDFKRNLAVPLIGSVVATVFVIGLPSIIKLPFLMGLGYFGYRLYNIYKKSQIRLTFCEAGLELRHPDYGLVQIPREQVDAFEWEAEDVREDSEDSDHYQIVKLRLAWNDDKDQFQELNLNEIFPPGTIKRLQSGTQRQPQEISYAETQWDE